jgi:hypothetical protein
MRAILKTRCGCERLVHMDSCARGHRYNVPLFTDLVWSLAEIGDCHWDDVQCRVFECTSMAQVGKGELIAFLMEVEGKR